MKLINMTQDEFNELMQELFDQLTTFRDKHELLFEETLLLFHIGAASSFRSFLMQSEINGELAYKSEAELEDRIAIPFNKVIDSLSDTNHYEDMIIFNDLMSSSLERILDNRLHDETINRIIEEILESNPDIDEVQMQQEILRRFQSLMGEETED